MNPLHLLACVAEHGFRVELTDDGPRLISVVEGATVPRDLIAGLKRYKVPLVEHLTACRVCGRDTREAEDRKRLMQCNPFCDLGECPYRLPS